MKRIKRQDGFTIPELIVTITMAAFMLALVMEFMYVYWRAGSQYQVDLDSMVDRMTAQDFLREYLGTSAGMIDQNSLPDQYPDVVDNNTSPANYWIPIHAIPQTINVTSSGFTPVFYFRRFSLNTSGNYIMNGSVPYEDEYVLYLDNANQSLRMRTIVNPATTGTNKTQSTCPDNHVTNTCPADKTVITYVSSVAVQYFDKASNSIDFTSSTDPNTGLYNGPDFPQVEVAQITFNLSRKPFLETSASSINSTVVRVALRNY